VSADDQGVGIAEALHEVAAGARSLRLVHVEARLGGRMAIWIGLCIRSPVMTARAPRDSINTLT